MPRFYSNFKYFLIFCLILAGLISGSSKVAAYSFVDEFNADTISNIYTGDEGNFRTRIGGTGSGPWNAWLQNWWKGAGVEIGTNPSPPCDSGARKKCSSCPDSCCSYCPSCSNYPNQCPEYYGTDSGNAKVYIEGGFLNTYRDGNSDGAVGACEDRGHRFPFVKSQPFEFTSNFQLEIRTQISVLGGWGIGWGIGGIIRTWYTRSGDSVNIEIGGAGTYSTTSTNVVGHWLKVIIYNRDGTRQAWIYNDDNQSSPLLLWQGSGSVSPVSGGTNVWFGNTDDNPNRYCVAYQSGCIQNDGMGNWPRLWVDYIRLNLGPENGPVSVLQPPSSVCAGEGSGVVRFQSTTTDTDGWNNPASGLKYVGFIINSTADGNTTAGTGNPAGAFKGRYIVNSFTEVIAGSSFTFDANSFYITADNGTNWLKLTGSEVSNTYVALKYTSSILPSDPNNDGIFDTLAVNWDVRFKSAWANEAANLWLRAEDMTGLYDGWKDEGDFGIDNTPPSSPSLLSPADGSCTDDRNPTLTASSSDLGCGNAAIQYKFRLDDDSDHSMPDLLLSRGWGDNSWETTGFNLDNGTYYWQAQAKDGVENMSNWSPWWSFRIPCNLPPSANNLSYSVGNYCTAPYPPIYLSWTFSDSDAGDTQSAYQVQADNNSDFSSPETDTWKVVSVSTTTAPLNLFYNTTYYWRVKVWDSRDALSVWATGPQFTTARHAYPSIDFSWLPENPLAEQNVLFTDQSTVYGGAGKQSRYWTFENGNPLTSALATSTVKFISSGSKAVSLWVIDSDGYFCSDSKTVSVGAALPFPWWREIIPF